jgi:hypothetical protein
MRSLYTGEKWEHSGTVPQTDFKEVYDPVRKNVFYNILIGCGIPIKIVRRTEMF